MTSSDDDPAFSLSSRIEAERQLTRGIRGTQADRLRSGVRAAQLRRLRAAQEKVVLAEDHDAATRLRGSQPGFLARLTGRGPAADRGINTKNGLGEAARAQLERVQAEYIPAILESADALADVTHGTSPPGPFSRPPTVAPAAKQATEPVREEPMPTITPRRRGRWGANRP